jgi:membrane protein YdbS with pleckstrin-like domain
VNGWLLTAGGIAAATTLIHATAGGRTIVRPLLRSEMAAEPKRTLHVVWHMVTADLLLTSIALLALAFATAPSPALVLFIAAQYLAYAAVFLIVTLTADWPRPLLQLPQWMLLLPVGVLALISTG